MQDRVMSEDIGEIFEQYGVKRFEWRIPDFMSLVQKSDLEGGKECYESPKFFFADCCWCFQISLKGNTEEKTKGWVGLYLYRMDGGVPKTLRFTFSIILANGEQVTGTGDGTYSHECTACRWPRLLKTSELLDREADIIPSGILTIIFTFKWEPQQPAEGSLFKRLWNLSLNLKNILDERKMTDVVLKLKDGEIPAHRLILESRSSVFHSMFGVNMREAETGVVPLTDEDEDTFKVVLSYAYSGNPEGLCPENAREVYKIALKYDLKELRKLCVDFMQECATVNTVCYILIWAEKCKEMKLKEFAKEFFAKNAIEVIETAGWNDIKMKSPELGFEVAEYVFEKKLRREK